MANVSVPSSARKVHPVGIVFGRHRPDRHHGVGATRLEQRDARVDLAGVTKGIGWLQQADGVEVIGSSLETVQRVLDNCERRGVVACPAQPSA